VFDNPSSEISSGRSFDAAARPASSDAANGPPEADRIAVLDILRGVALLGMFFVHVNLYEATPLGADPGRAAAFVERVLGLFFDERFYAIFGMLFGVGFALQLERADARGRPFLRRYLRRLAALAVFGFIAEGVFGYNVLLGYALWGVPLLLVRRWPVWALVPLVMLCAAARPIDTLIRLTIAGTRPGGVEQFNARESAEATAFRAARDSLRAAEQSESWSTVVAARIAHMPKFHRRWSVLPNGSFTLFLLGLIGWKLGLFTRPGERKRLIVALMVTGVASWVVARFVLPFGGPISRPAADAPQLSLALATFARVGFLVIREQWLAFTYVGAILLLVAGNPAWYGRLAAFGWAGRMALTNYMTQVILLDVLFTPHGFGMKVPALLVFPAAIALFFAQAWFSRWWLARFRYGPLEWLWRVVTNWELQPLRDSRAVITPRLAA
jgi:uncharacterized protein